MFDAHGWSTDGRVISQIAPTKVKRTYGSIDAFDRAHVDGLDSNALFNPIAAMEAAPPNVWLTSYYGFSPESWGFLGFTQEWMRRRFLEQSKPGVLVVIYGTGSAPNPEDRGRIMGIQQHGHEIGTKRDFVPTERWADEQSDEGRRDKWNFGVKMWRSWRVTPESRPTVEEFAPHTYSPGRATSIGAQGRPMDPRDVQNILGLDMVEVPFFGGRSVETELPESAEAVLSPSRPGPVSQAPRWVAEAEGPKHLYVLELKGEADNFLGYSAEGQKIVKVGMSRSPDTRRRAHNKALPACAFEWSVMKSTFAEGRDPFSHSVPALAGEQVLKDQLKLHGKSLGGEFFLAHPSAIDRAWKDAIKAAESCVS